MIMSVLKVSKFFQNSKINKSKIMTKLKTKNKLKETQILRLNADKSKKFLGWNNKYKLQKTVDTILKWNELIKKNSEFDICIKFVKQYLN